MTHFMRSLAFVTLGLMVGAAWAQKPSGTGVILLHGLGGSPMSMSTLAYELRERGHLVAAPELSWSAMRNHDVTTDVALQEVVREMESLRQKGARRIVLAGFSKGGLFAAHVAARHRPDALVLIAPNGVTRAGDIEVAQRLQAEGRGADRAQLELFDPVAQRRYPIFTTPDAFLSWFGPDSAIRFEPLLVGLPRGLPVLLIVPTRDLDNLLALKRVVYEGLPAHPAKSLYEPESNHIGAVNASAAEIVRWIGTTLPRR